MPNLLEIRGLHAGYGDVAVLHGIDLTIEKGTITALIGSNGVGKTTLMAVAAGLLRAASGSILFGERDITTLPTHERVALGMSLVPEGRLVFPDLNVFETLKLGAYVSRAQAGWRPRLETIFDLFPRLRDRRRQRASSLSGGEQQMLALGRGLMSDPSLLLLDEPSLGLAPVMADLVFEAISDIRKTGVTICLVEQDARAALALADKAYVVEHGKIVAEGSGATLLDDPSIRETILGL